ncbi:RDD family protein [Simiduia aestuariiviva]|uniref:Putative RDD family membrane protein YckC n=1 Tax=Simiduia aestuariiviva TaxID=1510459 RepID=A0A839UNS6_9GAMM|nr:RDD family protein [Simiduia aestuariiviva]MBB3169393.1 putative RDD family membrane protein YckC [Simiduia aestuariiviva]
MKLELDLPDMDGRSATPVRYAGFWVRFATFVIDSLCVALFVSIPLFFVFGSGHWQMNIPLDGQLPSPEQARELLAQLRLIMAQVITEYAILLVLYAYCWVRYLGTPGKLVLGLQVVDARTLGPLSVKQSIIRYLGYFVSSLAGCLGFIWVGIDARKQGFHDMMAHSYVIYRRD